MYWEPLLWPWNTLVLIEAPGILGSVGTPGRSCSVTWSPLSVSDALHCPQAVMNVAKSEISEVRSRSNGFDDVDNLCQWGTVTGVRSSLTPKRTVHFCEISWRVSLCSLSLLRGAETNSSVRHCCKGRRRITRLCYKGDEQGAETNSSVRHCCKGRRR